MSIRGLFRAPYSTHQDVFITEGALGIKRTIVYCKVKPILQWDTASTHHNADTSPMDLFNLAEHLGMPDDWRCRLITLQCFGESLRRFVRARFVSTLALVGLLVVLVTQAI